MLTPVVSLPVPAVVGMAISVFSGPGTGRPLPTGGLTPRQTEVLRMASRDLSNKQIARELHLSVFTVKNHFHSILEKLNVSDRTQAAIFAVRNGLVEASPS